MNSPTDCDVAILTDPRYEGDTPAPSDWYMRNILHEENLLRAGLHSRGLTTRRVSWSDPHFDWSRTRAAVFRSTWDYYERFPEFTRWLDRTAGLTRLINPPEMIRWNWDKHYLNDLEARSVLVPDTVFLERGSEANIAEVLASRGWSRAVLKPAVSGAGRHTYLVSASAPNAHSAVLRELLAQEAMLLQAFQDTIMTAGELSVIVIGGHCTHAVRKVAKSGEFRIHDDHGGTVHPHELARDEVAFAERAVAACDTLPAYARVDFVRDSAGELVLMELELIEPELFFRFDPPAADALAAEVAKRLGETRSD